MGQDLDSGPDNEQHEEHVDEMLELQPPRKAGIRRWRILGDAGILRDEFLHAGKLAQALRDGDKEDQSPGADRQSPQRADPALADADARDDPAWGGNQRFSSKRSSAPVSAPSSGSGAIRMEEASIVGGALGWPARLRSLKRSTLSAPTLCARRCDRFCRS
jgi:hypothetical protein